MKAPDLPDNEQKRLQALKSTGLLDSTRDPRFDRYTDLVAEIFDAPIALISLIDSDRQWFKSSVGLTTEETAREVSFCAHTILDDGLFIVPDALEDERFNDNPWVSGQPNIRFYAGCSLQLDDQVNLGTLCLFDTKPREFGEREQNILRNLAASLEQQIVDQHRSTQDDITELHNRQGFQVLAEHTLAMCAREQLPATLAYIDVAEFNSIVTRFGHKEGNRALNDFGELMSGVLRISDVKARLEWDCFAVLMAGANSAQGIKTLENIRSLLHEFNVMNETPYKLDFKFGTAGFDPRKPCEPEQLIEQAKAALQQQQISARLEQ